MKTLLALLLMIVLTPAAAYGQCVQAIATGGGYYAVYVDGTFVSQHSAERKAVERATNEKLAQPDAFVVYNHEGYSVRIEVDPACFSIEPVDPPVVDTLPEPPVDPPEPIGDTFTLVSSTATTATLQVTWADKGASAYLVVLRHGAFESGGPIDRQTVTGNAATFTISLIGEAWPISAWIEPSPWDAAIGSWTTGTLTLPAASPSTAAIETRVSDQMAWAPLDGATFVPRDSVPTEYFHWYAIADSASRVAIGADSVWVVESVAWNPETSRLMQLQANPPADGWSLNGFELLPPLDVLALASGGHVVCATYIGAPDECATITVSP
jgi:hypothetical protein